MKTVRALQLGDYNYTEKYNILECVEWFFEPELNDEIKKDFDIAFISRELSKEEFQIIHRFLKAHCLFIIQGTALEDKPFLKELTRRKLGKWISDKELQRFLLNDIKYYFGSTYGEKYKPYDIAIAQGYIGKVKWDGYNALELESDFGKEFTQAVYWRNNIPIEKNQCIEFWLEYKKDDTVEIQLEITRFRTGQIANIQEKHIFTEEDMKVPVQVENGDYPCNLFVSIVAKGKGKLSVIGLHDRFSRKEKGCFLIGGDRQVTSDREEVFFYFDPGDAKPPLNVYFAGYKTVEGFEGVKMMRRLGKPYLLINEFRLEGGAFYMGSKEYEKLIEDGIHRYMDLIGFDNNQVVFSGLSMGTYGALYYGCRVKPKVIILGKPLVSLGNVAVNERILRPGVFPTSLDVMKKHMGEVSVKCASDFNSKFWDQFDNTKWEDTKIVSAYMIEDDYDQDAYEMLISHLRGRGIKIYGRGIHGRHNDDTKGILSWFLGQYRKTIDEDFQ